MLFVINRAKFITGQSFNHRFQRRTDHSAYFVFSKIGINAAFIKGIFDGRYNPGATVRYRAVKIK
jgi:hypothetical protein